mgnify:CR=1 FL=1
MKIKFLKDHLSNHEGDEIETTEEQGQYLIAMQVAEEVSDGDDKPKRVRKPNK